MNHSVRKKSHSSFVVSSITSVAAATLLLAGCAAGDSNDNSSQPSDAASSASASATASSAAPSASAKPSEKKSEKPAEKKSDQPTESAAADEKKTEAADEKKKDSSAEAKDPAAAEVPENYSGANEIAKAPTVPVDHEQVKQTGSLYNEVENAYAAVKTTPAEGTAPKDKQESEPGTPVDNGVPEVDAQTKDKINKAATGAAADEFLAQALEYGVNGWSQEGSSKIVGEPKLADTTFNGKKAKIMQVCVDSSAVKVKDSAGNIMTPDHGPKRSLNIFTLVQENGTWKIAAHDFPNNPDC